MVQQQIRTVLYAGQQYRIAYNERQASSYYVFFMHGWGCAKECFDGAYEAAELNNYSLCSFDFIGYGASSKPKNFSYDLKDQAAITAEFIASFKSEKVSVVGHSMGGGIALLCATMLTARPKRLISAEGNLISKDTSLATRLIARILLGGLLFKFILNITGLFSLNHKKWSHWCNHASSYAIKLTAKSLVKWSDSGKLMPLFSELPAMYLYGETGKHSLSKALMDIPNKVLVPRAGHFMMLDNPKDFYASIAVELRK